MAQLVSQLRFKSHGLSKTDYSAPWLGSALFGCIISVPLNGRFGRRGSIFTATLLALFSALVRVVLPSWRLSYALFAAHLTAGTAMGILRCTCPLYLAETSFTSTRGSRIAIWQVYVFPL